MNKLLSTIALLLGVTFLPAQSIYYVNSNASGNNTGLDWQNAFLDLQSAIGASTYGDQIWVAQGIYKPTSTTDREIYFELKNGVQIYGGFTGTETALAQRNFYSNETILSGDIGIQNDSLDNSYTLVYSDGTDENTILEGFTIMHGNANNQDPSLANQHQKNGGGVYLTALSSSIRCKIMHCKFYNNYANNGAGIFAFDADNNSLNPTLFANYFEENKAENNGGGVFFWGRSTDTDTIIVADSLIFNNNSGFHGSSLTLDARNSSNYFKFINSSFQNTDGLIAGGLSIASFSTINFKGELSGCTFEYNERALTFEGFTPEEFKIKDCFFDHNTKHAVSFTFSDVDPNTPKNIYIENSILDWNTSDLRGGAINFEVVAEDIMLHVRGSTFRYNSAAQTGGAIYAGSPFVHLRVQDSYFLGNAANDGTGGGIHVQSSDVQIVNSAFQANIAKTGAGIRMINGEVLNCVFFENNALQQGGGIRCQQPTIANCIFKDNVNFGLGPDIFNNSFPLTVNNCLFSAADCAGINYNNSNITCDTESIFGLDPLFNNPSAGDFSTPVSSPIRDAGDASYWANLEINTDFFGNPRIQGNSIDIGLYETPALSFTASQSLGDCINEDVNSGEISYSASNAIPPLTINIGDLEIQTEDLSGTIFNLAADTYEIRITDATGSFLEQTVNISFLPTPTITNTLNNPTCAEFTNGSISVSATGETGNYNILWENGSSDFGRFGLGEGNYPYTITDASGCYFAESATLNAPNPITLQAAIQNTICSDGETGLIDLSTQGGNGGYTYSWSPNPNNQTGATLSQIPANTYTVTVTDSENCAAIQQFTVENAAAIELNATSTPASCGGAADGSLSVNAQNASPDVSYQWSNNATGANISGLVSGDYTVTAIDANGCTATQEFTVQEGAPIDFNEEIININCFGGNDGSINLNLNDPDLTYTWSDNANGQTSSLINNLEAGLYFVTITAAGDCQSFGEFTVGQASEISLSSTTDNACFQGNTGQIVLTGQGGTPFADCSYLFSSSPVLPSTNCGIFENVAAGSYEITAEDANGCQISSTILVEESEAQMYSADIGNLVCAEESTGSIQILNPPANAIFTWSANANGQDSDLLINLAADTYLVTVTDENSCIGFGEYDVAAPSLISAQISATLASCQSEATLTIMVEGGTPFNTNCPYSIVTEPSLNESECGIFTNAAAGNYQITITDENACSEVFEFEVLSAEPLNVNLDIQDASCPGFSDGSVTPEISGGLPPYTFDTSLEDLSAGDYIFTVSDADGCSQQVEFTISEPDNLNFDFDINNATNSTNPNGSILIENITGGTPDYSFSWENGATSQSLTGLNAGTYNLVITDANNCNYSFGFEVDLDTKITNLTDLGFAIKITPNIIKTREAAQLEITSIGTHESDVFIFDGLGQKIYQTNFSLLNGKNHLPLNTLNLPSGIYFIKTDINDLGTSLKKLVVSSN